MRNPMLSGLNQNLLKNNLAPIKNVMQMIKSASNPSAMLSQVMSNNPQYKQAMDYVQQNGGNAQKAFYKLAEENGFNPDDILRQIKP